MEKKNKIPKLGTADLVSLPPEVFYRHIFSKLEYSDLLRLRRVCETTKEYANDFIRNNFKSQVLEINETNYTLQHFVQANLTTSSIFINNSSPAFFEDPLIPEFLRLYGDQITHVRIHHFVAFMSEAELHFFSSLPNLQHLDLDYIDCLTTRKIVSLIEEDGSEECPFPKNFKNLKTLKLNEFQASSENGFRHAWDFIEYCEKLEYVKHPLYIDEDGFKSCRPDNQFLCVTAYIQKRQRNNPGQPNLRFYDLEHFNHGNYIFGKLDMLVELCAILNVKLLNVDSYLIGPESMLDGIDSPLVLLKNVRLATFTKELPNLEKLVVLSTKESNFELPGVIYDDDGDEMKALVNMPQWPNLKILDLKIDSAQMSKGFLNNVIQVDDFLNFLFTPEDWKKRENVTELAIRYDLHKVFFKSIGHMPIPRVRDVTVTCPFVTKLTLGGWMGTNKQVILFWKGLPLLEVVVLEECVKLGNVAFVGTEKKDPIFLKLKNLKKLSLKRMDLMDKITDLAFDLVFRHLKVKEFCLTSDKPIQSVTAAGIESLLTGNFNKSVEKFRFDGWSLDGVSEEAFMELTLKFRATYMI